RRLVDDHVGLGVVLAADDTEDLVALPGEELREEPAVLTGDPGDERTLHVGKLLRISIETIPIRFELMQELAAPTGLVVFTDCLGGTLEPVERAQEAAVRLVVPTHVAGTAPA